ncbi:homoserine kinase [Candidatus Gastranaerophilus sp. (ex Termes propinquus)]|nr:homoserine kinase [Candidatus Gastranaerophilus sp. (ex Termes propinquus)]
MFVQALHTKDEELMKFSLKDKLHQPYRMKLVPGMNSIVENLKHTQGVIGTVLSGAGPSIVVFSNSSALDNIKDIVTNTWFDINVSTKIYTLPLEENGAVCI